MSGGERCERYRQDVRPGLVEGGHGIRRGDLDKVGLALLNLKAGHVAVGPRRPHCRRSPTGAGCVFYQKLAFERPARCGEVGRQRPGDRRGH